MSRAQIKKKGDTLYSLPFNSKTHSTLKEKIYVPLYAEDLYFLTTRAGWKVNKIYKHYTFKQDTFKKDFVVMNQNPRKTAKTKFEKDFCKLLNNSNFGNDCRNNIGNCKPELIYDGVEELSYIKKYTNIFLNPQFRVYFSLDVVRQQIESEFKKKLEKYNEDDIFYEELLENLQMRKNEQLESISAFEKEKKRNRTYFNSKKINSIEDQN